MPFLRSVFSELVEIAALRSRYVVYLLTALLALLLAGSLAVRSVPARVVIFTENLTEESVATASDILRQLGDIELVQVGTRLSQEGMRAQNAVLGIESDQRKYNVVVNEAAARGADVSALAIAASLSLAAGRPLDSLGQVLSFGSPAERMQALPFTNRHSFVPRIIALLVVFAPFLVALESYSRQAASRFLQCHLAARGGTFTAFVFSKVVVATIAGWCTLLLLLLGANAFFGMAPKPGMMFVLAVYLLAAFVSGCFGVLAAMLTKPMQQIFGSIAAYFFILIVFSGFFMPIAGAEAFVQWASHLVPLRYPLPVLEHWLEQGQTPDMQALLAGFGRPGAVPAGADGLELAKFLALAAAAFVAVLVGSRVVRWRL